jgi:DsbC/DsbD-like thiol-disulfide interchange protein
MFILSRLITFLTVLVLLGLPQRAFGQDASPWVEGHRSRVRLLAGGAESGGALAGVEIRLDPGFKTYWRNPGEAGLPPTFDWSKSTNVSGIEVLWPAPARSEDAGGVSYGYQGQVVFPVRIRPQVPGKPVGLGLKVDYGVCKDICIPAEAELALKLPASASPAARSQIEGALARVPRLKPLDAEGDLAVLAVEPSALDGKPRLVVTVRAPAGSTPALFVEGPENWFLLPTEKPAAAFDKAAGQIFWVEVLERPRDAAGPVDLRFTLVAGDKAVETTASLDAARLER